MGILISFLMMAYLPLDTWLRVLVWLAICMGVYFGSGGNTGGSRPHRRPGPLGTGTHRLSSGTSPVALLGQ
ncbi:MAG: hypothetical protein LAN63_19215 [Acidobacteriia bacterium]|nr:hypothetical protein [Terriglobia bacterium]